MSEQPRMRGSDFLRDGTLFSDTTIVQPKTRPSTSRAQRLQAISDRILDRLEDEADAGFASELYDLSEALWNVTSAEQMLSETADWEDGS